MPGFFVNSGARQKVSKQTQQAFDTHIYYIYSIDVDFFFPLRIAWLFLNTLGLLYIQSFMVVRSTKKIDQGSLYRQTS